MINLSLLKWLFIKEYHSSIMCQVCENKPQIGQFIKGCTILSAFWSVGIVVGIINAEE